MKSSDKTQFIFKPLTQSHLPLLLEWLNSAHVQQFWDTGTIWTDKLVHEKYGSYIDGYKIIDGLKQPLQAFIIYFEDLPIGYIQLYDAFLFPRDGYSLKEVLEGTLFEKIRLAAIDIFLGEEKIIGRGIGSAAMKQFLIEHICGRYEGCFVDPDKTNSKAIRAYEKAGFVKIKELPDHKSMIMIAAL